MIAAVLVVLATHFPFAADTFAYDELESANSGLYAGCIQKSYERVGFSRLGGRPVLTAIPGDPPFFVDLYAHHPPMLGWMIRPFVAIFGLREWVIRALPILLSALTAGLLVSIAQRLAGRKAGVAALVMFASIPITVSYGRMAGYEVPTLFFGVLAQFVATRAGDSTRRRISLMVLVFLAALTDWLGAAFALSLTLQDWIEHRRLPRPGQWVMLGLGALVAIIVTVVLVAFWSNGLTAGLAHLLGAAHKGMAEDLPFGVVEGARAVGRNAVSMFGLPGLIFVLSAIVWALGSGRRIMPAAAGCVLSWTSIALLNVALFPAHARYHDYWWYYLVPAAVIGTSVVFARLASRPSRLQRAAAIGALSCAAVFGVDGCVRHYRAADRAAARSAAMMLADLFDERTLVLYLFDGIHFAHSFYLKPIAVPVRADVRDIEPFVHAFIANRYDMSRLVVLGAASAMPGIETLSPGLAANLLDVGLTRAPPDPRLAAFVVFERWR